MKYKTIAGHRVSCVGIGGHFGKMEEGEFEHRYTQMEPSEIHRRTALVERAVAGGINYLDTTWRNEVDMLAQTLQPLDRDTVYVNGMVLGAFTGSKAMGMDVCDYFDKWMDMRLQAMPGHYFDSFMINAIEEQYDEASCEKLVRLLERRKQNGDCRVIGFSCHDHQLARRIADRFDAFEVVMLAYNYSNRKLEQAFEGYQGKASLVAMKPLIWAEYGIPFCAVNDLPNPALVLGREPSDAVATEAIRWLAAKDNIRCAVVAVNSEQELDQLLAAGNAQDGAIDEDLLAAYRQASHAQRSIPFFLAASRGDTDNRRRRYFGLSNLARALGIPYPDISLNDDQSDKELTALRERLFAEAGRQGFGAYL